MHNYTYSADEAVQNQYALAQQWEDLVKQVRETPGFENFLQPKQYSELQKASHAGPVVVLNISELQCDAIILISPSESPIQVCLDKFSYQQAQKLQGSLHNLLSGRTHVCADEQHGGPARKSSSDDIFRMILAELWIKVVRPVLDCIQTTLKVSMLFSLSLFLLTKTYIQCTAIILI